MQQSLLTSVQLAQFVTHGFLRLDEAAPDDLNNEALEAVEAGIPRARWGAPLEEAFPPGTFMHRLLSLPNVRGAIHSLVGPGFGVDHHAVHLRGPEGTSGQPLHADRLIDLRRTAFDVQLMYYPQEVTAEMGGTLLIPGSHLRRTNEADIARYQNLRGQQRLTGSAGMLVFVHHGLWHCGLRNRSQVLRYMLKVRLNPRVRQLLLWDTSDIDSLEVAAVLRTRQPWCEGPSARLELLNRIKLWQALTGDERFDVDYWYTRVHNEPRDVVSQAGPTA